MRRRFATLAAASFTVATLAGCTAYSPTTAAAEDWELIRERRAYRESTALASGDHLGSAVYYADTPYQRADPTRFAGAEQPAQPGR